MPTGSLTVLRGIDGTVSTPYNLNVLKWQIGRRAEIRRVDGFGDGNDVRVDEGAVAYTFSLAGQANTTSNLVVDGTAYVELASGTNKYTGVAYLQQASEAHERRGSNTPTFYTGHFDGDPTHE